MRCLLIIGIFINVVVLLHMAYTTRKSLISTLKYNIVPYTTPELLSPDVTTRRKQSNSPSTTKNVRNCSKEHLQPRAPHQHVYYLKTHKTGSTTMYSIFAEYCRSHGLLPLVPRDHHINQSPPVRDNQLLLPRGTNLAGQKFDMVFNHHVYSSPIFKHLYDDTVKITTIREPFQQFISSFTYFRAEGMGYLRLIPGEDPLMELLKDRKKYEAHGYSSYTNNRQSMDLGYDIRHSFNDTEYISKFIKETEQRFDLVLITDYFHESLVIMRRYLRWSTQDILYFSKNKQRKDTNQSAAHKSRELTLKTIHATFSQADTSLYNHFLPIFKQLMSQEDGLDQEVAEFEAILDKVRSYCNNDSKTGPSLIIPTGKWSDQITLLPYKCKWLKKKEVAFTSYLQKRQAEILSFQ